MIYDFLILLKWSTDKECTYFMYLSKAFAQQWDALIG